jgi:hypothetical protein
VGDGKQKSRTVPQKNRSEKGDRQMKGQLKFDISISEADKIKRLLERHSELCKALDANLTELLNARLDAEISMNSRISDDKE